MPTARRQPMGARLGAATALAVVAAVAIALGGCGGSGTGAGAHRSVTIRLTEYRIAPQTITAPHGFLTLIVYNAGRRTHNLVVTLDGNDVASTKALWPGQQAKIRMALPAGNYQLASTILDDQSLGEYGTLKVS